MQRFFLSLPSSVVSDKRKRSIIVSYQIRLPAASEVSRARPARGRVRSNEQKKTISEYNSSCKEFAERNDKEMRIFLRSSD